MEAPWPAQFVTQKRLLNIRTAGYLISGWHQCQHSGLITDFWMKQSDPDNGWSHQNRSAGGSCTSRSQRWYPQPRLHSHPTSLLVVQLNSAENFALDRVVSRSKQLSHVLEVEMREAPMSQNQEAPTMLVYPGFTCYVCAFPATNNTVETSQSLPQQVAHRTGEFGGKTLVDTCRFAAVPPSTYILH
ncbi:hypothetical protein J1614_007072 [Plenodomus biglobosus]|nr:hypothetical protein J1614_007072 [Plenodomus biglobosus]